jgi:hypothetical protein
MRLRNDEEARHHGEVERHNTEMEKMAIYGAYEYSRPGSIRSSRTPSQVELEHFGRSQRALFAADAISVGPTRPMSQHGSIFTAITGQPRQGPEPRQPVREGELVDLGPPGSRLSYSIYSSSGSSTAQESQRTWSPAQQIAWDATQKYLLPQYTGTSQDTNPFRKRVVGKESEALRFDDH